MLKKVFLLFLAAWGTYVVWRLAFSSDLFPSNSKEQTIELSRGPQTLFVFPSKQPTTSAIIIFGSGDGGWSTFEESIGLACQNQGYELVGIDTRAFAKTDYDLASLQADFRTIARTVLAPFPKEAPPLIEGGYSMGAAQAVAVAGGPNPPPKLVGLVLIDMLSRGRYGLRSTDEINVLPTGPGTFGVVDFIPTLSPLRIVQWHAQNDDIDSREWLDALSGQYRELDFPGAGHGYENNRSEFIRQLMQSIGWIIDPKVQLNGILSDQRKVPPIPGTDP